MRGDLTGLIVALGSFVPELATTLLSFMKHGVKMAEFGVASNLGTAVLSVTIVPAFAALIALYSSPNSIR